MNNRQFKKIIGNKNKKRVQNILEEVNQYFTTKNISFIGNYSVFKKYFNCIAHFDIKEVPDWKFGIHLDGTEYHIFGEHIELIDKFKPTRTYVSYKNSVKDFINEVIKIQENPVLYFVDSLTLGRALVDFQEIVIDGKTYYDGYQAVHDYNSDTKQYDIISRDTTITQEQFVAQEYTEYLERRKQKRIANEKARNKTFSFFKGLSEKHPNIIKVGIEDQNSKRLRCNPRYNLYVFVDPSTSHSEIQVLGEILEKEIIEINSSNSESSYDHQINLSGIYDFTYDDPKFFRQCSYVY